MPAKAFCKCPPPWTRRNSRVLSEYPALKIVLTSGDLAALDGAEHEGFFLRSYDGGKVIQHIKALLTEERAKGLGRYST
jgi:hypothetical protein